jgi:hypothetical protein
VDQRVGFSGKRNMRDVAGRLTAEEEKITWSHGFE